MTTWQTLARLPDTRWAEGSTLRAFLPAYTMAETPGRMVQPQSLALLSCFAMGHFWGYFGHFAGPGTTKSKAPETFGFRGFLVVAGCGLEPQT